MSDTGPPEPIKQENIKVVRTTDPQTGYVVTKYVNASGKEVGLPQTFHLQGAGARFSPPPS
jgi:hypothetical protein